MSVKVIYKKHLVGKVVHFQNQYHFKYDNTFFELGYDLAPITMPIAQSRERIYSFPNINSKTFYGLPGLLADSLPDNFGNNILNAWLAKNGKNIRNLTALERLSYLGNRAMGGLEFVPDELDFFSNDNDVHFLLNDLSDVAQQIIVERNRYKGNLKDSNAMLQLFEMGTSAGGARAKAVVNINDKTADIVSGHKLTSNEYVPYLIKFDTVSVRTNRSTQICLIEFVYYKLARKAGIDIMKSKLIEENGRFHFATQRFDRTRSGEKVHIQTLCAIGHYDFRDFTHNSYENLFFVARKINVPYRDREQLYRRMIFNVLARNQDDHTKNFAFLMNEKGKWKVTPAYDINFNYDPKGLFTQSHKMSINGKVDNFNRNDLIEIGKQNSIVKPEQIFEEVKNAVSFFSQISEKVGVAPESRNYIYSTFRMDL